jgi:hypothetical protein
MTDDETSEHESPEPEVRDLDVPEDATDTVMGGDSTKKGPIKRVALTDVDVDDADLP